MSKQVHILADLMPLPDGNTYRRGQTVTLTDEQFARIPTYEIGVQVFDVANPPPAPQPSSRTVGNGGMTTVYAGSNANTPRPNVPGACYWVCNAGVTPVNAIKGDIIFNATS